MKAGPHYIIVKIDIELQRKKRERLPSGIYIPPEYIGMTYNLQFGEIVSIGEHAAKSLPYAKPGDLIIFKHTIEDDDSKLVKEEKKMFFENNTTIFKTMFEYKAIHPVADVYGIINNQGNLVPADDYVFLSPIITIFKHKAVSDIILADNSDNEMWDDPEILKERIEELKIMVESLQQSYSSIDDSDNTKHVDMFDEINRQIDACRKEQEALTKELHRTKLASATVLHINDKLSEELEATIPGDKVLVVQNILYPIDIAGNRYLIADKIGIYGNLSIGATVMEKHELFG